MRCTTRTSHPAGTTHVYASFAAATLIVLGVLITVLGFLLAASMLMVVIGLGSVLAGGMLSVANKHTCPPEGATRRLGALADVGSEA